MTKKNTRNFGINPICCIDIYSTLYLSVPIVDCVTFFLMRMNLSLNMNLRFKRRNVFVFFWSEVVTIDKEKQKAEKSFKLNLLLLKPFSLPDLKKQLGNIQMDRTLFSSLDKEEQSGPFCSSLKNCIFATENFLWLGSEISGKTKLRVNRFPEIRNPESSSSEKAEFFKDLPKTWFRKA